MRNPALAFGLVLFMLAGAMAAEAEAQTPASEDGSRLVLILMVDQMRYDYLERFGPLLEGGLKRLMDTGVVFTDGHQDHGVVPLPEVRQARGEWGRRAGAEDILCFQGLGKALAERLGEDDWILTGSYLNYETVGRNNLRRQEVESELARLIESCPDVDKVWTRSQLEGKADGSDPYSSLYWRSFHPRRSPDLFIQRREYFLTSSGFGTTHGSPHRYDTHVPIIFWTDGLVPARISSRAATVDVAPTLGAVLDLDLPDDLDGLDHSRHLGRVSPAP